MIKAFKIRAQAIFSLLEKTHPLVHKFWLHYKYPKKLYTSKTVTVVSFRILWLAIPNYMCVVFGDYRLDVVHATIAYF
jgi:hypothetical protein